VEDVLELTERAEDPPQAEPLFEEQRVVRPPPRPRQRPVPDEMLMSPPYAAEAVDAFSHLTDALERQELPIGAGYKTLEQLTKEVMRPMLREWLDANLPSLVERLVQEEITRMVQRATKR
jgi:cell pole-organizing protein PopZ